MENGQTMRLIEKAPRETGGENSTESGMEDEEMQPADGMNIWQTAVSVTGSSAGLALLAVDVLIVTSGWAGLILFLCLFFSLVYTSVILGRCWNQVRDKWGSDRSPFGAICYEAYGTWARKLINFLVAATCFTNAVAILLGLSEMTLVIGGPALRGTLCYWPPLFGLLIGPFLWLGTPKNFWWMLANSFLTVVLTVVLVVISIFVAGHSDTSGYTGPTDGAQLQESRYLHLAEIAGTLIWLMGMHGAFPTLQQDMKQPQAFTRCIILAHTMTLCLSLPVMSALFIVHGNSLTNISGTAFVFKLLPEDALKSVSALLILMHLAGAVLMINNPLNQYLEELCNVSRNFSWKRVALRSSVLVGEVFIQETLPQFTLLASISGALLTPLLVLITPCLCYLRLRHQGTASKWFMLETVVCIFIIAATPCVMLAILVGTGTAIARGETAFTVPCYVNATQAGL